MKVIHEVNDWETKLTVATMPQDGLKLIVGNGTPKGSLVVSLSQSEVYDLFYALAPHVKLKQ
jgi:hypothetical protein